MHEASQESGLGRVDMVGPRSSLLKPIKETDARFYKVCYEKMDWNSAICVDYYLPILDAQFVQTFM